MSDEAKDERIGKEETGSEHTSAEASAASAPSELELKHVHGHLLRDTPVMKALRDR